MEVTGDTGNSKPPHHNQHDGHHAWQTSRWPQSPNKGHKKSLRTWTAQDLGIVTHSNWRAREAWLLGRGIGQQQVQNDKESADALQPRTC